MRSALTRRFRLRRAIERGDPRLGMIVGLFLSLLCGLATVAGVAEPLELKALDVAFQRRSPIRESEKILLVDIDDLSLRELPWPIPRESYGQAILALDRLGAKQIVFDVQFKTTIPDPRTFDEKTGEYFLGAGDNVFRYALARSGKVTLPYSFDLENPLSPELQKAFPAVKAAFAKKPGAGLDEVSRLSGVGSDQLRNQLERARERALVELVSEAMERAPQSTFSDIRAAFLPGYDSRSDQRELKLLQYGYWNHRCRRAIEAKSPAVVDQGGTAGRQPTQGLFPTFYPFLERADGVGCVNAQHDSDGVMRRPWTHLQVQGRYYPYLGLQIAQKALESEDERVETVLRPGAVEIRRLARVGGAVKGAVSLPVDAEGRVLVNWAGNAGRRRGSGEECFVHLPFLRAVEFYQKRYDLLDDNVRRTIAQLSPEERESVDADKYLKLSDRLNEVLRGRSEVPAPEVRAIEDRMEKIRARMVEEFNAYIAAVEERLPKITAPRPREQALKDREKWREQVAGITAPDDVEKQLRPLVEGRICLIGSAYTASGDLHATPLGSATPGMDVLANVANMALTGQVLRRAPGWASFAYLFVLGLLVSYYVTHGSAAWSAAATGATMAASGVLYWALFTGPAILVPAAGPVVTAVLTFAGVTAYKELLTQRSKRKLQRELEKNTSAELVKILMEHPEFLSEPRKMIGTFFFSDVKSFTSISEKMNAEVLFPFINRYLDRMTQNLKAHQAFVDKYIGDGIMALFGIPVPTPEHARLACQAALDCQAGLKPLNAEFALQGLPQIKVRIGIHSGEASAGNVGALDRSNYTVLGDNVNLAARLEGANKEYDSSICISEATWELVSDRFVARELDRIRVVGKRNAVRIYELLAVSGQPAPVDPAFLEAYGAALALFKDRRWPEAIAAFQKALELKPGDKPSQIHIERAKVFQLMPPPPDWEGVFDLSSK